MDHNNNSPTIGANKEIDILPTFADPVEYPFRERKRIINKLLETFRKIARQVATVTSACYCMSVEYVDNDDADFLTWKYFDNNIEYWYNTIYGLI